MNDKKIGLYDDNPKNHGYERFNKLKAKIKWN